MDTRFRNHALQKLQRFLILGLICIILLGLFIGGGALAQPPQQNTITTVKIGYIGQPDSDLVKGLQLAISQINNTGGIEGPNGAIYTFELVQALIASDNVDGVSAAVQSLVDQDVIAIFGPDTDRLTLPNITNLSTTTVPIFTAALSENVTGQDTTGNIFRIVAPEKIYSEALAEYLTSELDVIDVTIIRIGTEWDEASLSLESALGQNGSLSEIISLPDNSQLGINARSILESNPPAVAFYGVPTDALLTLQELRRGGWQGVFVYRNAQEALINTDEFDDALVGGMIGVSSWSFGATDPLGRVFLVEYVQYYGELPNTLAVAGYDAFFTLATAISRFGTSATNLRQAMTQIRPLSPVHGPIDPARYGNRDLSHTAYVYQLNGVGGLIVLAAYDDGILRETVEVQPTPVALVPTATITPSLTPSPTATIAPATPTPSVLTATVITRRLNVRSGPDTIYDPPIGQLAEGDQVAVIGKTADSTWYAVNFQGQQGWVTAEFVRLYDPGTFLINLPILVAPATPTPRPSPLPNEPDLVIVSVVLSVTQPEPGVSFSATITVRNQGGGVAPTSVIATNFRPDETAVVSAQVPSLTAGQTIQVVMGPATLTQTGYVPDLAFLVDFNQQVNEGATGEGNNVFTFAYKVDEPTFFAPTVGSITAPSSFDFYGGTTDVSWDGTNLTMAAGGNIGQLVGSTFEIAHYQQAAGLATGTAVVNPATGSIYAFKTVEGYYGYLRVDSRVGTNITFTYRVYNP